MPRRIPAHIRKLMKELKQGLVQIYGDKLKAVYLYCSYARGDYRDGSDIVGRLDEVSAIDLGFPHGFLDGNQYIYGATHDLIDNHRI